MSLSEQRSDTFWYVGYGSLINQCTRPTIQQTIPVRLQGFAREWSYRNWGSKLSPGGISLPSAYAQATALNVVPIEGASIAAVLIEESMTDLASLDDREGGYARHLVTAEQISPLTVAETLPVLNQPIYIYQATAAHHQLADMDFPILQSYVDVVLSGVLSRFPDEEAPRFVADCRGFQPIKDDRAAPIYPRAQSLSIETIAEIDRLLTLRDI